MSWTRFWPPFENPVLLFVILISVGIAFTPLPRRGEGVLGRDLSLSPNARVCKSYENISEERVGEKEKEPVFWCPRPRWPCSSQKREYCTHARSSVDNHFLKKSWRLLGACVEKEGDKIAWLRRDSHCFDSGMAVWDVWWFVFMKRLVAFSSRPRKEDFFSFLSFWELWTAKAMA